MRTCPALKELSPLSLRKAAKGMMFPMEAKPGAVETFRALRRRQWVWRSWQFSQVSEVKQKFIRHTKKEE
jgi:hypothetical protein